MPSPYADCPRKGLRGVCRMGKPGTKYFLWQCYVCPVNTKAAVEKAQLQEASLSQSLFKNILYISSQAATVIPRSQSNWRAWMQVCYDCLHQRKGAQFVWHLQPFSELWLNPIWPSCAKGRVTLADRGETSHTK